MKQVIGAGRNEVMRMAAQDRGGTNMRQSWNHTWEQIRRSKAKGRRDPWGSAEGEGDWENDG
jgi:hypothetical protein